MWLSHNELNLLLFSNYNGLNFLCACYLDKILTVLKTQFSIIFCMFFLTKTGIVNFVDDDIKYNFFYAFPVVSFGHRSIFPQRFDGNVIERWWKAVVIFKVYSKTQTNKVVRSFSLNSLYPRCQFINTNHCVVFLTLGLFGRRVIVVTCVCPSVRLSVCLSVCSHHPC